jgi:hypothetical protein
MTFGRLRANGIVPGFFSRNAVHIVHFLLSIERLTPNPASVRVEPVEAVDFTGNALRQAQPEWYLLPCI